MRDSTVKSSRYEIFASTAPGLESIVAGELKALGVRGRQTPGGVSFEGDLERVYEANLWLRAASRVVLRMGRFHASTFYELERRARKLPWAEFLPAGGAVGLRVTCRKSKLYHSDAVAERLASAITGSVSQAIDLRAGVSMDDESAGEAAGEPERADATARPSATRGPSQLFVVRIVDDQCEVSADSSGELLHRRGYRQEIAKAPLRETLAAAMVLASGWKGEGPLADPMCGSGTIPIEAAMIAGRIAPGLSRRFQFMEWPGFEVASWNRILEMARGAGTDFASEIVGSDRDAGAVAAAARNAERSGVGDRLRLFREAVSGSIEILHRSWSGGGLILTNPPYGVRVGEGADLRNLYASLGSALRSNPGWRLGVLTTDARFVAQTRLPFRPRFSTLNGGIGVTFYVSEKNGGHQSGRASRRSAGNGPGRNDK